MGTISLNANIQLQNVLFVPIFKCNLISNLKDLIMVRMIGSGDLPNGVYVFKMEMERPSLTTIRRTLNADYDLDKAGLGWRWLRLGLRWRRICSRQRRLGLILGQRH
ncbi:hypothetical protein CR513_45427, partial [Mucuna pruriens]